MILRTKYIRRELSTKIMLFIIWPFGSFIYSLSNLKSKSSFLIFFIFCILFGYTFLAQNESMDSFRYVEEFNQTKLTPSNIYYQNLKEYISFDTNIKDFYVPTCNFLVSRLSGNYHILMALYATIFAFFYLSAFRFLVQTPEFTKSLVSYLLAFLFTFSNPIFNINGVRFWTAAWIAVYCIFQIIVNKNKSYIFLAFITPIIHITYLIFLGILIIYLLSKKYTKIWMIVFLVSFFISNVIFNLIDFSVNFMPVTIQNMIWSYTNDNYLYSRQEIIENLPLYVKILEKLPDLFLNSMIFIFLFNSKIIKENQTQHQIYVFLLVLMTFVNLTSRIPSLGDRFLFLSIPFITYLCLLLRKKISLIVEFTYLIPIVFSYSILYWIRNMASISDPYLYFSNFFNLLYKDF